MNYNIPPETKLKWNNPTPQALIVRFYIAKLYYFIRAGNATEWKSFNFYLLYSLVSLSTNYLKRTRNFFRPQTYYWNGTNKNPSASKSYRGVHLY